MIGIKKGRKLGFFAALAMLVGTVVGIGIFFKNGSIQKATHGDGLTWLMAWIVGGIIAAAAAISFSEIGSIKSKSNKTGLPAWSEEVVGKKFGKFVEFNYSFFYMGGLVTIFGILVSEMIIMPLIVSGTIQQIPIYGHVLIGLLVTAVVVALNYLSLKASGLFQKITLVIKFVPLIFALVIGIVLPTVNHSGGFNAFTLNKFTLSGLIVALPAVLFAYDAFMVVASMTNDVKDGERKVPIIILIGMISIIVLYTLIAISSILHNAGTVSGIITNVLPTSSAKAFNITIFVFIMISASGVINGIAAGSVAVFKENVQNNGFFGSEGLKEKIGVTKTSLIYLSVTVVFWTLVIGIPSIALEQDYLYDGFSNFPTLFFFVIYGIVIAAYSLKRKQHKTKKINSVLFYSAAATAVIGITLAVSYLLISHYIIDIVKDPNGNASWGLFASTKPTKHYVEAIILAVDLVIFFAFPAINYGAKKLNKREKVQKVSAK